MKLPKEQVVKIGGKQYKLSKFDINLADELQTWAKSVLPNPFDGLAARMKDMPPELQKDMYLKAEKKAEVRGTDADSEYVALTNSVKGVKKIMHLLFKKYQPELSEDEVAELVTSAVEEHGEDFFAKCFPEFSGSN